MRREHGSLFEVLEPPPGGLAGLRGRIERDSRRRRRLRRVGASVAGAAVIVLFATILPLLPRRGADPLEDALRPARLRLGLLAPPTEILTVSADKRDVLAATRVPLETDDVVLYLVASLETEQAPE